MSFLKVLLLLAAIPVAASAQWQPDVRLSTADTGAALNENMGRCLAVSGDSVYIVWCDTKTGSIYHKHSYNDGLTWSADMVVATGQCAFPSIAVSGGSVHIAYRGAIGKDYYSYYIRSLDGGNNWTTPTSLGKFFWWPSITCEGGHVYLAINDTLANTPYNSEVYFLRSRDNGTTWDSLVRISNASGRSEDPSIAVSNGCIHMAWNDNRTGIMQTWYRRSTDMGTTWLADTQLTNTTAFCYFPILCATDSNIDLAYGDRQTGNYEIYLKQSFDSGATWDSTIQITHAGGTNTEAYPVITRSGSDIHMVWFLFNGGLYYQHSGNGGVTWDSAQILVNASSKPGSPFIAVGNSMTHVIWLDHRDGVSAVYYKRTVASGTSHSFDRNTITYLPYLDSGDCFDTAIYFFDTTALPLKISFDSIFGAGMYVDRSNLPVTLAPMGTGTSWLRIPVRCCAEKVGTFWDTVLFITEDTIPKEEMFLFELRGVAFPTSSVTRSIVEFGEIDSGASSEQVIRIMVAPDSTHRFSTDSSIVDSVRIEGSPEFIIQTPTTPFKIGRGSSIALTTEFSPVELGQSSATLSIFISPHPPWRAITTHQDTLTVKMRGTGAAATNSQNSVGLSDGIDKLQSYPNPANGNPSLYISSRTNLGDVRVEFYNAAGVQLGAQHVRSLNAGEHTIALALPAHSGPLIARIVAGSVTLGELKIAESR